MDADDVVFSINRLLVMGLGPSWMYAELLDDTDEDGTINMYDEDDDGDGILTKDELDGDDPDNMPDDSNNDGIPDYLDKNT